MSSERLAAERGSLQRQPSFTWVAGGDRVVELDTAPLPVDVVLTREDDIFVPLEVRLTRARSAGADIFLSLHADALASDHGSASGMTVYTLASDAEDAATERLTERHGASDILTGVDLTGAGDDVAQALSQVCELTWQLRGEAGDRQVEGAKVGITANQGLFGHGSSVIVKK